MVVRRCLDCPTLVTNASRCAYHARRLKERRTPSAFDRDALLAAGATCAYCGEPATVLDHAQPVSRRGTTTRENLAPSCESCNLEKGSMTAEEYRHFRAGRYV